MYYLLYGMARIKYSLELICSGFPLLFSLTICPTLCVECVVEIKILSTLHGLPFDCYRVKN